MRIATWNVNSIRVRELLVAEWLRRVEPDVVCLQETKVLDDDFPTEEFQRLGYSVATAGQKSYNGVALLSRSPIIDVQIGFPGDSSDAEKRLIAATVGTLRIYSVYVPNGKQVGTVAFTQKLAWLHRLATTLAQEKAEEFVVAGDFNIARDERDLYDPEAFRGRVHFHPDEHRALGRLFELGLTDAFRLHQAEGGHYSWWDYRGSGVGRNEGLRIDYVFLSRGLAARCIDCRMDAGERLRDKPSDHIPVVASLDL